MKKFTTLFLAAAFVLSAGSSFAASNFLQDYQNKRNAAIKKQDARINEMQKKQEAAQKKREADKAAYQKKQQQRQEAYKKQQEPPLV